MKVEEIKKENWQAFAKVAIGDVFYFPRDPLNELGQRDYYMRIPRVYAKHQQARFGMVRLNGDIRMQDADDEVPVVVVNAFLTVEEIKPVMEIPT